MPEDIYALKQQTAQGLLELLGEQNAGSGKRAPVKLGQRSVLVECISATSAVGNSIIASECFSGLLLEPLSTANGTLGAISAVWLTVIDGNVPGTPTQNQTYLCLMAGDATLDVDAGNTSITRPRVFGVKEAGGTPFDNILINGHFAFYQRYYSTQGFSNANYTYDRWFALSDTGGNVTANRGDSANLPAGTLTIGNFTHKSGGANGVLVGQWIPNYMMRTWTNTTLNLEVSGRLGSGTGTHQAADHAVSINCEDNTS